MSEKSRSQKWREYLNSRERNEHTSARVGTLGARVLGDPKSTPTQKSIAGSALTQVRDRLKKP